MQFFALPKLAEWFGPLSTFGLAAAELESSSDGSERPVIPSPPIFSASRRVVPSHSRGDKPLIENISAPRRSDVDPYFWNRVVRVLAKQ